jgi:hypothetical protein
MRLRGPPAADAPDPEPPDAADATDAPDTASLSWVSIARMDRIAPMKRTSPPRATPVTAARFRRAMIESPAEPRG